jgi:hypothetical protein
VDDLQSPNTQEHVRVSRADERLRNYPSDRGEAWLILGFLFPLWLQNPRSKFLAVVVIALAVALISSAVIAWARRTIKRRRESER